MWEQDVGVFPVSFQRQGDEWAHHLSVILTGNGHMGASGTDGQSPVELGPPLDGPVSSKLYVRPHEEGISCMATGEDESEPSALEQAELWRAAAAEAASALGQHDQVFTWEAILGTSPHTYGLDRIGPLKLPQRVGPIQLSPGGVCSREQVFSERLGQGFGLRHSFPIIASGEVTTYTWNRVQPIAELCLRRTCALLSLFTGGEWIPRTHPRLRPSTGEHMQVPAVFGDVPEIPGRSDGSEWRGEVPADAEFFELPDWLEGAWPKLDADAELARAVDALYEAMRLEQKHPSLAHLTFVAAVEGFGMRFVPDASCDCHAECRHQKPVAQKRFRKALKTVMTDREVRQTARLAYELRSSTGHSGNLFGSEVTFGYSHHGLFEAPYTAVFDYGVLGHLRNASRRVLATALGYVPAGSKAAPGTGEAPSRSAE
ncbi:MAG: hypothetical protein ACLQDY_03405 [Streptosporangiaceae bacterium]